MARNMPGARETEALHELGFLFTSGFSRPPLLRRSCLSAQAPGISGARPAARLSCSLLLSDHCVCRRLPPGPALPLCPSSEGGRQKKPSSVPTFQN